MKQCTKCGVLKAYEYFHKDKTHADGMRSRCKDCIAKIVKQYYALNKSRIIEKVTNWVQHNRDKHNKVCKKWVKNNKASVNQRTANRYARKTNATPKWVDSEELWLIKEVYDLAVKRTKLTGLKWHVDHIIPLRGRLVSGLHTMANLQVILAADNVKKSNRYTV
jgi:hypothetical protein